MLSILVRRETLADVEAIDEIHRRASTAGLGVGVEPVEVGLVRALRVDPAWVPALSLVAERDGAVVGHVVATGGSLDGARRSA